MFSKWFTLLILLLLVSACQSEAVVGDVGPSPPGPTETLPPSRTPAPEPDSPPPAQTQLPPSPSPSPSPSPTPTEPPLQIHSPLAKHTLGELPEIVSSPYDPPEFWDDARHHGVDFCYFQGEEEEKTIEGEGIQAIFSGVVVASIEGRFPYGNMVIVETAYEELPAEFVFMLGMQPDESLYHLYAHFQEGPEVGLGERVEGGQALGQVGKTGYNIEVPHLHLETRIGSSGAVFERMVYYDVTAKEEEMEAYELWRTSGVFRHFDPMEILGGAGDGGEEAEDE